MNFYKKMYLFNKYKKKTIIVICIFLGILSYYGYAHLKNPILLPFEVTQWIDEDRPGLVYVVPDFNFLGDREAIIRLVLTAKKMGWNVFPDHHSQEMSDKNMKNVFGIYVLSASEAVKKTFPLNIPLFTIDWIVPKKITKDSREYNRFLEKNSSNFRVKAVLGTSYYSIDRNIKENNKVGNLKFLMTWYPTVGATDYQPNPVSLMYCGHKYIENIRSESEKYKNLWRKLDKTGYFFVYGSQKSWKDLASYRGYIPADGKSFLEAINKHGICLVMHNDVHLKEGVPSGRIFEAAAAAAVIISDKHPFVEREFGDSVLYIDETRDDMFEQIEEHMRWIKENPEKAKSKAQLAHAIFLEKFTLEDQLNRLYKNIKMNNLGLEFFKKTSAKKVPLAIKNNE